MTKDELLDKLNQDYRMKCVKEKVKYTRSGYSKYKTRTLIEMRHDPEYELYHEKEIPTEPIDFDSMKRLANKSVNHAFKAFCDILRKDVLFYSRKMIDNDNLSAYVKEIELSPTTFSANVQHRNGKYFALDYAIRSIKDMVYVDLCKKYKCHSFYIKSNGTLHPYEFNTKDFYDKVRSGVLDRINTAILYETLGQNALYHESVLAVSKRQLVLDEIPENFIELYPKARLMNRRWKLHVGPTNSGKTYESLEELRNVHRGLYLAPLRLLALEVQERLLENSVLCNLTTGEEEDIIEGATHCSSTIEKLDINKYYDLCVIDEAQMIVDRDRGWAWTRAILGVCASEVHVCMSENALNIVCRLIQECGEEYEVIRHNRNTELIFEEKPFQYPNDVRKHDALVVFSRKSVLAVASELEAIGKKVSVLYGNLPYKVRKEELRKFRDGDTDIVVTTDCIGMGMNINVERVVFLSSHKFDGVSQRPLNSSEVKQIAGRAGRMGMFEKGYVNALEERKYIKKTLEKKYTDIPFARFEFPETLINLDEKLSDILIIWSKITDNYLFVKTDLQRSLLLCRYLEQFDLTKEQMLKFINIPFDERNRDLLWMWERLIKDYVKHINLSDVYIYNYFQQISHLTDLTYLETAYKKMDLLFSFLKSINSDNEELYKRINQEKEAISTKIIQEMKKRKTSFKSCRRCSKKMAWNHPYSICEECHESSYRYWDDFEYF